MTKQIAGDSLLTNTRAIIRATGKKVGLTADEIEELITPDARHVFKIDIADKSFPAFRVQHSNKRGPYKGGIRFHPEVNVGEVEALSLLMSIKTAAVGIPLGGGKGGVSVDPRELTVEELEELSRKYVRHLHQHIGPTRDVPAPDVNTDATIMDWMIDEYQTITKTDHQGAFTGKSLGNGGSSGREAATGRGGLIALEQLLNLQSKNRERLTIAIEGFGNVGYWFAKLAADVDHLKVVAVSDSSGGIVADDQLDIDTVMEAKKASGSVTDYKKDGVRTIDGDELTSQNVDILVLAALSGSIHNGNVNNVPAQYIVELANGPISDEAYRQLHESGTHILPDVVANAGGVIVSFLEWQQNNRKESWSESKVNRELEHYMQKAVKDVYQLAQDTNSSMKDAAFHLALRRITD